MKTKLLPLICLGLIPACSSYSASEPSFAPAPMVARTAPAASERKIQTTATMSLKAGDVEETAKQAKAIISEHKGILSTSSITDQNFRSNIKVPANRLEPLMGSLAKLGKVTRKEVQTTDITDNYFDLEAALINKRALRDRLRLLLEQTKEVEGLLKVEEQLARVQTELDQMESRIKRMRAQVAHSTLNFSIERQKIINPFGALSKGTKWAFGKVSFF